MVAGPDLGEAGGAAALLAARTNCEEMINTDPLTLMSAVVRCVGRRGLLAFCPAPPAPPPSSGGRLMWGAGPLKVRTLKLIVNVLTFKFYPSEAVSCGAG